MNVTGSGITVAGLSGTLFATASSNLDNIDGAFGLSSADWRVICFSVACLLIIGAAAVAAFMRTNQ